MLNSHLNALIFGLLYCNFLINILIPYSEGLSSLKDYYYYVLLITKISPCYHPSLVFKHISLILRLRLRYFIQLIIIMSRKWTNFLGNDIFV